MVYLVASVAVGWVQSRRAMDLLLLLLAAADLAVALLDYLYPPYDVLSFFPTYLFVGPDVAIAA